ncbi:hypothetical protein [Rhodobacter aestuarii]|nr:hypothetical protein [Rhodobacter aestuarii]
MFLAEATTHGTPTLNPIFAALASMEYHTFTILSQVADGRKPAVNG